MDNSRDSTEKAAGGKGLRYLGEPREELNFQSEIKLEINAILWKALPSKATMSEAEDVATACIMKIIEIRQKYECTGPES